MSVLAEQDRSLIASSVNKFVDANYPFETRDQRRSEGDRFGQQWSQFAELGWLMLPFGEAAGGMGGTLLDAQVLTRAFGRGLIDEPWLETIVAGKVLEHVAGHDVCESWLAELMSGETIFLLAHGEHRADLDFTAVATTAVASAEGFRLSGTKRMVWQAGAAQQYLVTALLDGQAAVFMVDRAIEGVSFREYTTVDGRLAADIDFQEVALPGSALICRGEVAQTCVKRALLFAFGALIAEARGIAECMIQLTAEYLNTRKQFGATISKFQSLQHMLADMVIAKEEIQSLEWMTAELDAENDLAELERATRTAKARAATAGRKLCELGVQLHGGVGLTDEYVASHYLRRMLAIDGFYGDAQQQLLWLAARY
ncbi:MAG: acyl-CoA dehydrogenase family protein [Pseudomonadales bacterium]